MNENVVTQKLRDFTVQIRPANSENIVGTGIVVSIDGKVVTCAHVVKAAGVEPHTLNGKELVVYFPQAQGGETKDRRAKVIACFPDFDDDIVLLQLMDGSAPLGPEKMPVLGTAENSQGNGFRSYGYRRLEDYIAGWAHGTIHGHVEAPLKRNVQAEPVQLESNQINRGMSGSAVLDIERNLVIGIISETWFPDKSGKDSDTGWAVDSRVLSLAPLGLPVQDVPLPYKPAPEPKTDEETKQQVVQAAQVAVIERHVREKNSWNNAPSTIPEWTGRNHLLTRLTEDWNDPKKRVTGLIGFGGEGKSSLARKWVDGLIKGQSQLDGVFWWGFYENRSVDEFFEAALNYMSGGRIDPRAVPSSNLRAQIIGSMLNSGRYLFVLDGLEVMQHQEGDQYGLLQSNDLRDLLTFFARLDNKSFCLITSRAPVLDLMDYTTYTHRDVERLSEDDGRTLLQTLRVKGSDAELNKVVADWGGHALTLSILAAYLVDRYDGDIKHLVDIPVPTANEPRYERVHRLLRRYDEHLTNDEREFLKLFSVFRLPVQESAFEKVFVPLLKLVNKEMLLKLVSRLASYRLIRRDEHEKTYTTHPLIRNHYFAHFTKVDPLQEKIAHEQIKDYYLAIAGDTPQYPTLDDLKPLIEVVHYACQAGAYDEAMDVYIQRISQVNRNVMWHELSAYDTVLSILLDFFPTHSFDSDPKLSNPRYRGLIFSTLGGSLLSLGRLLDAILVYEKSNVITLAENDWLNASVNYRSLANLHALLGSLAASTEAARQALNLARLAEDANKNDELLALVGVAWSEYLKGEIEDSKENFSEAEKLEPSVSNQKYLTRYAGIQYAQYLRRTKQIEHAHNVTIANIELCERYHWHFLICRCHRVLGDLDSDVGDNNSARAHYESAHKIARSISRRDVLIEVLLARGRFLAKHMKEANAAFSDLNEALDYCVGSGYRIYEADVRVALAWAYLVNGEKDKAKQSAERALQMSNEMGYYWGKVDVEEVLKAISG